MFQGFLCTCELRRGYLAPLHFFYMYCIDKGISDLTRLEQDQINDYFNKAKEIPLVKNRYHQIVDKAQRILFLQAKDINWEANVWYLDRFQFDETRYNPTRPVRRISFLDIADRKNREYLKIYKVSAWCDGNLCPKYLGADIYYKSLSAFS